MYVGYDLIGGIDFGDCHQELVQSGRKRYNDYKSKIETEIGSFVLSNGKLDGSKMQDNWFPQINADVFISHSRTDLGKAIALSQWLFEVFGLNVFVDSCIWGYANDLLRMIDNEYCLISNGKMYDYNKRNSSTSHVHMMLSTALTMMIDKSECVLFLNTPNSITTNDVISKTKSPWIYSEIAITKLIKKELPTRYQSLMESSRYRKFSKADSSITVEYIVDTEHLNVLDAGVLSDWERQWEYKEKQHSDGFQQHPLDLLYEITLNKKNRYGYFRK